MEESNELPSDDNKMSLETNKKRIIKTPAQINGLENFYSEHKYPTEEQKTQLVQELGLTEKQVSGWFCHRRLKDKRLSRKEEIANGRKDRLSGVIPDNGSGHRQDSSGSTKQGSHLRTDPREVESRSHVQGFPGVDLSYDHKRPRLRHATSMDDTSSESSLPLQDRIANKNVDPHQVENSKYLIANGFTGANHVAGAIRRQYKPSGYLKVRGEVEHGAITTVKMRLGRHYFEDGPPLSVQFESVPPDAFRTTVVNSAHEPYFVEDPDLPHSPDISGAKEEPIYGMRYGASTRQMNYQERCAEVANPHDFQNAHHQHNISQHYSKQRSPNPANHLAGRHLPFKTYQHAAEEAPAYNHIENDKINSRLDVDGFTSDYFPDHSLGPYNGKNTGEHTDHVLHKSDQISPKNLPTNNLKSGHPRVKLRRTESLDTRGRGPPKMMHRLQKEGDRSYGKTKLEVSHDQTRAIKRDGSKVHRQECMIKTSAAGRPPLSNQFTGSAKEVPSSFSEDEETSSSLN